ncbi:uncharacterized protein LOC127794780 [Diospyros lotus]|uniref:uncharacterized protein LOC127794780 n=1 Tax=Diospyros lotus TaxID=55363 RepID=UPI00224C87DA|nr:uncharacterized protein LOC127794780 [Diospyros lotus]
MEMFVASQAGPAQAAPVDTSGGQVPTPTVQGIGSSAGSDLLRNFMALHPPKFYGGINVSAAENWILSIKKHLRTMGCTNDQKEAFNEHYFPDWVRERKMYEFIDLVQGVCTVAQYEAEFTSLAHFAPVVQRAHAIEGDLAELHNDQTLQKVMSSSQGSSSSGKKRKWEARQAKGKMTVPLCPTCGKRHSGVCRMGSNVCYQCDQPGHVRSECPQRLGAVVIARDAEITCFRCGRKGHRVEHCTFSPQPGFGGQHYGGQGPRPNQRPPVPRVQGGVAQQMAAPPI